MFIKNKNLNLIWGTSTSTKKEIEDRNKEKILIIAKTIEDKPLHKNQYYRKQS